MSRITSSPNNKNSLLLKSVTHIKTAVFKSTVTEGAGLRAARDFTFKQVDSSNCQLAAHGKLM
jgi:hypothetical protein